MAHLPCGTIDYPVTAFYGQNVLDPAVTTFKVTPNDNPIGATLEFDFAAKLSAEASLRVRMTALDVDLPLPGPFPDNVWWMENFGDWLVTNFDLETGSQVFVAHDIQRVLDINFGFAGQGRALIEYFECDSTSPTRQKTITWSSSGG